MSTRLSVYLDSDDDGDVETAAHQRDGSKSDLIRDALLDETNERPYRLPRFGLFSVEPFSHLVDEILAEGFGQD